MIIKNAVTCWVFLLKLGRKIYVVFSGFNFRSLYDHLLVHSPMETLLDVQGLTKHFPVQRGFFQKVIGWIKAVDGVDFRIEKGKTLGLVGESGCGKSTIGRLILRLLDPDNGKILYNNQNLSVLSQQELKPLRKEMQIIFQDPFGSLNPRMNVGQSIEEGLRTLGVKSYGDRQTRVKELLEMVGLPASSFRSLSPRIQRGAAAARGCRTGPER